MLLTRKAAMKPTIYVYNIFFVIIASLQTFIIKISLAPDFRLLSDSSNATCTKSK